MKLNLPLCFFTGSCLLACQKGDKVPAYLTIPAITLTTTDIQGSNSSKITDVWVHADEELVGVYELPARVPVLREGMSTITLVPAVKRNGMFDDRVRYPFYTNWSGEVDMLPTQGRTVEPVVQLAAAADIFFHEAFEDAGTLFNVSDNSDTTLLMPTASEQPGLVAYGNACAGFVLDTEHPYMRMHTTMDFNGASGQVYLEIDHRNSIQFTVGMMFFDGGSNQAIPHVHISPTGQGDGERWNKVYLDVSSAFNGAISQRNVYIEASLPGGHSQGAVYLDNIKLMRFQQ